MPRKNTRQRSGLRSHHVYNRGAGGQAIFIDDEDRRKFIDLLKQFLSATQSVDSRGRARRSLRDEVSVISFCLLATHFHLILWQKRAGGMARLMQPLMTEYSRYFNTRHGNTKPLFNGEYRAKPITNPRQFRWTVAYVNDNHPSGLDYKFSSHNAFIDENECPGWLNPKPALDVYGGKDGYLVYLENRRKRQALDKLMR
jgi:putative transposase